MRATATTRLTVSVLCAVVLHGAAFGVAAVVLSGEPVTRPTVPAPLDVDLVEVSAPRPDPVADAPAGPALAPARLVAPARRRFRVAPGPVAADEPPAVAPGSRGDAPEAPSLPVPPSAAAPAAPRAPEAGGRAPRGASADGMAASAQPRYRSNPKPEYPLASRRRREEGTVLLDVAVGPDGLPGAISLHRSSGYPALDRAAQEQVRRAWTFEPARTADGIPVSGSVVVNLRFSLSDQP